MTAFSCDKAGQRLVESVRIEVIGNMLRTRELGSNGSYFFVSRAREGNKFIRHYDTLTEAADGELERDPSLLGHIPLVNDEGEAGDRITAPPFHAA